MNFGLYANTSMLGFCSVGNIATWTDKYQFAKNTYIPYIEKYIPICIKYIAMYLPNSANLYQIQMYLPNINYLANVLNKYMLIYIKYKCTYQIHAICIKYINTYQIRANLQQIYTCHLYCKF